MTLLEYFAGNEALRSQWAEDLNTAQPSGIDCHEDIKVWWRCDKGHEWEARVNSRVYNGRGCPYCSNKSVLPGFNDLATIHPEIAAQWHPTLNGELSPSDVTSGSKKSVWWCCGKGHEWQTRISNRAMLGTGCPSCKKEAAYADGNDLATAHPELAAQWHPTLNGELSPQTVSRASKKQVWWRCKNGHEWQAAIKDRVLKSNGCPYCSNQQVSPGENDLATTEPQLLRLWHPELNGDFTPDMVTRGSKKRVWWQCEKGHSWQAPVYALAIQKTGCPVCAGKQVQSGVNDLASLRPELMAEWDFEKNVRINPSGISSGSRAKVWWRCSLGHGWEAKIYSRTREKPAGCPYCAGRLVYPGFNDLATLRPDLAEEWYQPLNGDLTPSDVTLGKTLKAWWQCAAGHVWQAAICARTAKKGTGCPVCAGSVKPSKHAKNIDVNKPPKQKPQPKDLPRPQSMA